ncbi:MAG: hypothetical protein JO027_01790 [Solirubrobacterales bacterium]|nr:hypothetical protein [Solirubrobacterales bacterium]
MISRAILAGAVALALSGCGSGSPSMTRLRAQATRVCTRSLVQGAQIAPPATPARTGQFLHRGIAVLGPELAALGKLHAPSEQAGAYSAALASLTHALAILTSTAHDLDRGADPLTTIKTLQHRLGPVEANANAAWRTLGVPACVTR